MNEKSSISRYWIGFSSVMLALLLFAQPTWATTYELTSSGDWSDSANWTPTGAPTTGDTASISNGLSVTVNSEVSPLNLYVGNVAGTSGSMTINSNVTIGSGATGYLLVGNKTGASGTITQTAGTVWAGASTSSEIILGQNGASGTSIYNLDGSSALIGGGTRFVVGNGGVATTFNHKQGTMQTSLLEMANYVGVLATYNLTGGTMKVTNLIIGRGRGLTGTQTNTSVFNFNIGDGSALNNATMANVSGSANMTIGYVSGAHATFQGNGTVGFTGLLTNNGRIIADGGTVTSTDKTLNLTSFTSIANTIENTGTNGWFATNHCRLALPDVTVATGTNTVMWGENSADTDVDLVNSIALTFNGVTDSGSISGSLLSDDYSTITVDDDYDFIGIWNFTSSDAITFSSLNMTFSYDSQAVEDLSAADSDLRLLTSLDGITWSVVDSVVDATKGQISTSSNLTELSSFYAIGVVPEPATMMVLFCGGIITVLRKKRYA